MQDSLFSQKRPPPEPVQGVSSVVSYIRKLITHSKVLAGIRVRGEVSNLSSVSGRLYFKLKEDKDVLECVAWAGDAAKLPAFKDGDEVICGGEYGTYSPRSQYQLAVKSVELTGAGMLFAQFEALRERFRQEGLFEKSRKRKMPDFPRRIAVISARGRGVEDFFTTLTRRAPYIDVTFIETRVQGDGAEMDIGEAIDKASRLNVDVIVVTRGGGSYEDLFPFNREPVVRAIVRAKHPVLSAVGHTEDVHLSDFVADYTCETPSNAAQYFGEIADRYALRLQRAAASLDRALRTLAGEGAQRFDAAVRDLRHAAQNIVTGRLQAVHALDRRLNAQTPQQRVAQRREKLTQVRSRLDTAARYVTAPGTQRLGRASEALTRGQSTAIRAFRDRLGRLDTRLSGLDPNALLARGYAIVTYDGRAVLNAADVPRGSLIEATVQHGKLLARVEEAGDA